MGGCLAQCLAHQLGCPHAILDCLGSNLGYTPDFRFLQNTHAGRQQVMVKEIGLLVPLEVIWLAFLAGLCRYLRSEPTDRHSLPLSVYPSLSLKQKQTKPST